MRSRGRCFAVVLGVGLVALAAARPLVGIEPELPARSLDPAASSPADLFDQLEELEANLGTEEELDEPTRRQLYYFDRALNRAWEARLLDEDTLLAYADFLVDWAWFEPGFADRLATLAEQAPPEAFVLGAMERIWARERADLLFERLFAHHPGHPVLMLLRSGTPFYGGSESPEWVIRARGQLRHAVEPVPVELEAQLSSGLIETFLSHGLTGPALAELESLPAEVRELLIEQGGEKIHLRFGGLTYEGYLQNHHMALAAAYAVEGRYDAARRLLERISRKGKRATGERATDRKDVQRALHLLRRLTTPAALEEEPFSLLVDLVNPSREHGVGLPTLWLPLAARLAAREGYPAFERYFLAQWCANLAPPSPEEGAPTPGAFSRELVEESLWLRGELAGQIEALADATASVPWTDCRIDPHLSPSKDTESAVRFLPEPEEQPCFAEDDSVPGEDVAAVDADGTRPPVPTPFPLPPGFEALAVWTAEGRSAALAAGPSPYRGDHLDGWYLFWSSEPFGRLSRPALLPVSTWRFEVDPLAEQKLLLEGDLVRVAALDRAPGPGTERREECSESLTGWLELSLSEVLKDTDGDGLTDVEEGLLRLDPQDEDTDGDGLADRQDPLPNLGRPSAKRRSDEREAFYELIVRVPGTAVVADRARGPSPSASPLFLLAPSGLLDEGTWQLPTILMSEDDPDLAWSEDAVGRLRTVALEVRLFALSPAGDRAILVWQGLRGSGALDFARRDGLWRRQAGHQGGGCIIEVLGPE